MKYQVDNRVLFMTMWQNLGPILHDVAGSSDQESLKHHVDKALSILAALVRLTNKMVKEDDLSIQAASQILDELDEMVDMTTIMGLLHAASLAQSDEDDGVPDEQEDMS